MRTYRPRMRLMFVGLWLSTSLLLPSAPAVACGSCLLLAPTVDTVRSGQYSMEVQEDSTAQTTFDDAAKFFNTEFGLARNLEAGVDLDISDSADSHAIGNAKYRFELGRTPIAVGIQGIDGRFKSVPFVTTSIPLGHSRFHAGALRSEENTRTFCGIDLPVNSKLTLLADYVSGDEFFASAGISYSFTGQFSLLTYAQFPNDGSDVVYSVHLIVCGSVR